MSCWKQWSEILLHVDIRASHSSCRFFFWLHTHDVILSQSCTIGFGTGDCGGHLSAAQWSHYHVQETNFRLFNLCDMVCYSVGSSDQMMGSLWSPSDGHGSSNDRTLVEFKHCSTGTKDNIPTPLHHYRARTVDIGHNGFMLSCCLNSNPTIWMLLENLRHKRPGNIFPFLMSPCKLLPQFPVFRCH